MDGNEKVENIKESLDSVSNKLSAEGEEDDCDDDNESVNTTASTNKKEWTQADVRKIISIYFTYKLNFRKDDALTTAVTSKIGPWEVFDIV